MFSTIRQFCAKRSISRQYQAVSCRARLYFSNSIQSAALARPFAACPRVSQLPFLNMSTPWKRSFSTVSENVQGNRERFTKYMRYLQEGDFQMAIEEMKLRYASGYRLPKQDVFSMVSQICESKQYGLVNEVISIITDFDKRFFNEHAPLFCYALLLSGDMNRAISLLSSSGDAYLDGIAQKNKDAKSSQARTKSPTLPQEYLFSRMCIRMMGDTFGTRFPNKTISHGLRRRNLSESTESIITSSSIVSAYLYAALYLVEMNSSSRFCE